MRPNPEYLKNLLIAFQNSPEPTTDIRELERAGIPYRAPEFQFHMLLLLDEGYIESESRRGGIGLDKGADGSEMWSVIPLRLTASGHEFAEGMRNSKTVATLKEKFVGASISTMSQVAIAIAKSEIAKHTGLAF